jgi:ketosteroid isomerase-like protein
MIDAGDVVIRVGGVRGRGAASGAQVSAKGATVWTFSDGKLVSMSLFQSESEALEAAGLSEQAMSQENIERMRQALAAFERGDKETWLGLVHDDIEAVPMGDWPEEAHVRGREAVWDFLVATEEPWEPGPYELGEVADGGDHVAARTRRDLRGKSSGVEVEFDLWAVLTFRDGKVTRVEWFEDRQAALEAAGLRE